MLQPANPVDPVITHVSVQDAVVNRVRNMILSGHLRPGDRLPQDELASNLGVSTMPVREALRQLQVEGLVVFRPRRGAAVAEFTASDHDEIYSIRQELEELACLWLAESIERVPIDRLKLLLEEIEAAEANQDDVPRRLQLVRDFFFAVFEATGKQHLLRILSNIWDLSHQYRLHFYSFHRLDAQRLSNYRRIYQACRDRDPEALINAFRIIWHVRQHVLLPLVREEEDNRQAT
jgi:DNA-binding GntR family transcriptional regulator